MKKKLLTLIILFLGISRVYAAYRPDYIHGMNEAFEDENFYACVSQRYNGHSDQYLTDEQLASIDSLYCYNKEITSTKGLEKLTSLTSLTLDNNQLTNIDVSKNTALTNLSLNNNQLTNINLSKNTALTRLELFNNQLTNIDVSNNTALQSLNLEKNQLTSIDISKNTSLTYLTLSNNQLTSIDVSSNNNLTRLTTDENVEVIGANDEVRVEYVPLYLFPNSNLKFSESDFKSGNYEYTITVGNNINKLSVGYDASTKGFYYNCPDDTLCGGYYLYLLLMYSDYYGHATINDKAINLLLENKIDKLYREQCNDEVPCNLYKDDELIGTIDENYYITFYDNGEEIGFYDMSNMKLYYFISDLEVGTNVLKFVINAEGEIEAEYTINIIRSEKEIENSNPSEEFNEIIEEIVNDNKVEAPVEDKTNEVLSIVPNTGIILSVSLSVVSVILIGLMYYKYYHKKKNIN